MLQLSQSTLSLLWPAYALIDREFVIQECGPAITNRYGELWKGKLATDFFDIEQSFFSTRAPFSFKILLKKSGAVLPLGGVAVAVDDDGWALLMNFNVSGLKEAIELGLSSEDFGIQPGLPLAMLNSTIKSGLLEELKNNASELLTTQNLLQQSVETRLKITSYLCHDFSNLLSVISFDAARIAFVESKKTRIKIADNIKLATVLGTHVSRSISRMYSTTANEVIHLDHWATENLNLLKSSTQGSELILDLSSDDGHLFTDSRELLFSLLNLLINAKEASSGRSPITLKTRREESGSVSSLKISIHNCFDPGSGLESFSSVSTKGAGRGLGLVSVQHFCNRFNGELVLETAADEGTVVSIILPAHAQCTPSAPMRQNWGFS